MLAVEAAAKNVAKTAGPPDLCPLCGSDTEKHVGVIVSEPDTYRPHVLGLVRRRYVGAFTVCTRCEWAVENATFGTV